MYELQTGFLIEKSTTLEIGLYLVAKSLFIHLRVQVCTWNMYFGLFIFNFCMQNCKSKHEWFMIVAEPLKDMSTLISLITVEVGINVKGVQKLQNK